MPVGDLDASREVPRHPPFPVNQPIRLAVCVSGGGRSLQNLIDRIADHRLIAQLALVVAQRPGIGAIDRATRANIPVVTLASDPIARTKIDPAWLDSTLIKHRVDLVILAGFLALLPILDRYRGRIFNIHPSLIPAFCGPGMYGDHVHRSAVEAGVKISGCTVHIADERYDTGPIVIQRAVPVDHRDDANSLAARVFEAECEALPEAITAYAEGRITIDGRRVQLQPCLRSICSLDSA